MKVFIILAAVFAVSHAKFETGIAVCRKFKTFSICFTANES